VTGERRAALLRQDLRPAALNRGRAKDHQRGPCSSTVLPSGSRTGRARGGPRAPARPALGAVALRNLYHAADVGHLETELMNREGLELGAIANGPELQRDATNLTEARLEPASSTSRKRTPKASP
jgi:hypothetical protein